MRRTPVEFFLTFCLLMLVAITNATAQGTASRVTGTVVDPSGAVVPAATVTLTNEATNVQFTTETTDAGTYTFESVQVGVYTVAVEAPSFKRFVTTGNQVNVNQPATVDVSLETGGVNEVVQVESTVELVQTSSSGNFGNTVEERPLEALPIVGNRGRNPLNFVNFQPGVVVGSNTGGGVHVHGSRDRAINYTLDGIDINETSAGGANFTPVRVNPDSVTQFQVVTGNFTAELGRSSGAQVSLVTRSGTNRFSGNLFEFYQTPRFQANDYVNTVTPVRQPDGSFATAPRQQFVQNIFGGSLGGPIFFPRFGEGGRRIYDGRNKTFFFTNVQLLRTSQSILVNRTVYTQQARAGQFRYAVSRDGRGNGNAVAGRTGTVAPSVDIAGNPIVPIATFNVANNANIGLSADPTTQRLINLAPLPNNFIVGDGLNTAGFAFAAPQIERQYDLSTKIDHAFNENNNIYVRYSQGAQNTFGDNANGGLQRFPGLPNFVDTFRTPRNVAVNYRAVLSPVVTNEFVVGFNRFTFSFNNPDPNFAINPPVVLNIPTDPLNREPTVNNLRTLTTRQIVDNLSYIRDAHTFRFGTNLRFQTHLDDRTSVANAGTREAITLLANGTTSLLNTVPSGFGLPAAFNATANAGGIVSGDRARLENFVNDYFGRIGQITQSFVANEDGSAFAPAGTRFLYEASYPEFDFFAQDSWKLRPNLTIDYGLRYEVRLSPRAPNDIILRPDRPIRVGEAPTTAINFVEGKLYDDAVNLLAPTVGIAYDPFNTGKTSIRGNYRLAYDRTNTFVFSSFIFQSAPGLTRNVTRGVSDARFGSGLLRDGLPVVTGSDPLVANGAAVTPQAFRTATGFSASSINVVDPALSNPRTHQYGVSLQREVGFNSVIEINYIGRQGRKLYGGYDANQVDFRSNGFLEAFRRLQNRTGNDDPILSDPNFLINQLFVGDSRLTTANNTGARFLLNQTINGVRLANGTTAANIVDAGSVAQAAFLAAQGVQGGTGANRGRSNLEVNRFPLTFFQPFPQFSGAVNVLDNNDRSRYNALEIQFARRFNRGLGFQISYTLAKSEDTRSFDPAFAIANRGNAQSAANTPFDINNRDLNYARSDFDRRHALQGYFTAEVPFGRGRRFLSELNPFLDRIIGGFEFAGIIQRYSGRPITVYSGVNTLTQVVQTPASCNDCSPDLGSIRPNAQGRNFFFLPEDQAQFFAPAAGEFSNVGRNYFTGPPLFQLDLTLGKRIRFTENTNLEIRLEAQNATNTPAFNATDADANLVFTSGNFGSVIGSTNSIARRVQLAAKFNF